MKLQNPYKLGFWLVTPVAFIASAYLLFRSFVPQSEEARWHAFLESATLQRLERCENDLRDRDREAKKSEQTKRHETLEQRLRLLQSEYGDAVVGIVEHNRAFYEAYPDVVDKGYFEPRGVRDSNRLVPPRQIMTQLFFRHLNRLVVKDKNYEAAVNLFLPIDERLYGTTLGASAKPEEILAQRLGLYAFLPADICGVPGTPTCEDLLFDPSCDCPRYRPEYAPEILKHIMAIEVQPKTNSAEGLIQVRFDQAMTWAEIKGVHALFHTVSKGEPYKTQFTRHWDIDFLERQNYTKTEH